MRRRSLRAHRAGAGRRLLPLHSLPAPYRNGRVSAGADRRPHVPVAPRRGVGEGLAPSRRRFREGLLPRMRGAPVQPQPRRPRPDERAHGGLRRRPGGAAQLAYLRRLRGGLGSPSPTTGSRASRRESPGPRRSAAPRDGAATGHSWRAHDAISWAKRVPACEMRSLCPTRGGSAAALGRVRRRTTRRRAQMARWRRPRRAGSGQGRAPLRSGAGSNRHRERAPSGSAGNARDPCPGCS